jgi:hypothetical protein
VFVIVDFGETIVKIHLNSLLKIVIMITIVMVVLVSMVYVNALVYTVECIVLFLLKHLGGIALMMDIVMKVNV